MSLILAAPPYQPPPIPLDQGWSRITHTLYGWDGSEFVISDPDSGCFLTHGVIGMKNPVFRHHRDERASLPGSLWRGYVEESREVFWPIYLYSDESSADWITRYRAFWRALHPAHTSTWEVRTGTFGTRRLRVRLEGDSEAGYEMDPLYMGWAVFGINLRADQPLWEGEEISRPFQAPTTFNFSPDAGGPPFFVAPYMDADSAALTNPGDVESHLIWTVEGPQPTGVTVGFAGNTITAPFNIPSGQTLTIDTRPEFRTAVMNDGTKKTHLLTSAKWAALPPGENVELSITQTGTGKVSARFTPLYWRAL